MLQVFESDSGVFVDSGFVYLPLLYDLSVEEQLRALRRGRAGPASYESNVVNIRGRYYIRSLNLRAVIDNYGKFDPETSEYLRRSVFNKFLRVLKPGSAAVDEKLGAILFQVIPYFIRKKDRLHRRHSSGEDVLDIVGSRVEVPDRFQNEAEQFFETSALRKRINEIASPAVPVLSGQVSSAALKQWVLKALESKIIEEEKKRLGGILQNREKFAALQKRYIATLLYVKERGSLELNGCGFFRAPSSAEYFVYVRTGRYALKDFYGHIYLFPDCRVAVSTGSQMIPYVLDRYKHPFLKAFDTGQKICVRGDFSPASRFSANGAIQAIEEGISALFHGYNSTRGNGYHRLDGMKIEDNSIVFEELRISANDPRILSGEIEVKNDFY